ncbi:RICIN domain-containing protein [endosymbiont 'TC1' of Trimyema compressum]|uniref:RICIN domain-containing protein n=1 Tax=endosymbiont 'TC1' of Trimyema compressum TaxID=243899 RepID=UPI00139226FB|nr:RICIN domain-containing protein [endosymbiont 'TC1' of Trimyema compressum]
MANQTDPVVPDNLIPITDLADGYYSINSTANGLALETVDSGYDNGLLIKQNIASNKSSKTTYFEKQSDGSYVINFYHSKKALDVNSSRSLTQWSVHKGDNQRWLLYKDNQNNIYIKSKYDNSFIEIKSYNVYDDLLLNSIINASDTSKQFKLNKLKNLPTIPYVADVANGLYKIESSFSGKI